MQFYQEISDTQSIVDQGDVFKDLYFSSIDTSINAVVITPTCDLVKNKAHYVKYVSCVSLEFVIKIIADSVDISESTFNSQNSLSGKKHKQILKLIRKNTTGDFLPRYYFLPKYSDILLASYLDLQGVFVIPFQQVMMELLDKRIAKIATPWRESITSQYASYSMRIGTPEYADDELNEVLRISGLKLPI